GAANSNLIAGPRIYFAASRDGLVPHFIQKVHPSFHTPANSILIQGIWTSILIIAFYSFSPTPKDVFDLITDAVICAGLIFYSLPSAPSTCCECEGQTPNVPTKHGVIRLPPDC
ncbi:MAG: amino acid permease, partial [Schlesneria sp.]